MQQHKHSFFRPLRGAFSAAVLSLLSLGSVAGEDTAQVFNGRGVHAFASGSGCPHGLLTGNKVQCNRIAIDEAGVSVQLDTRARTIQFSSTQPVSGKTVVGDVLLQGSGASESGQRVPLTYHLVLSKHKSEKWSLNAHLHAPVRGDFSQLEIDTYTVTAVGGDGVSRVVATPESIHQALAKPSLMARLADEIVHVHDNQGAIDKRSNGDKADITISLGALKLEKPVMRARMRVDSSAPTSPEALLSQGTWSVELQPLTGQIPRGVAQRELFLYGLDGQALLKPVLTRGFVKHEALTIGAVRGEGYIRLGGQQQAFAGADAAARVFLQQSFVGLILGQQVAARP